MSVFAIVALTHIFLIFLLTSHEIGLEIEAKHQIHHAVVKMVNNRKSVQISTDCTLCVYCSYSTNQESVDSQQGGECSIGARNIWENILKSGLTAFHLRNVLLDRSLLQQALGVDYASWLTALFCLSSLALLPPLTPNLRPTTMYVRVCVLTVYVETGVEWFWRKDW